MEKKFNLIIPWGYSSQVMKLLLFMKLTLALLLIAVLQSFAINSYSQTTELTLDRQNSTVEAVLQEIESKTEFKFLYSPSVVDEEREVDIQVVNSKIETVLDELFNGTNVTYSINDRQIVLTQKEKETSPAAQPQQTVTGKVTDASGGSLPGVTVVVKGTSIGVITDLNGNYSLSNVPTKATLIFSFVGMSTQEVAVGDKTTINVTLLEDKINIEEIVAVGYTSQSKRNLTSAVATASGEELTKRIATDPVSLLQGQMPGLQVTQGSGEPGSENVQMRIRGVSTFSGAGNDPLIIIDGIPGNLSALNPNNIESVSLLKDAASAAIYGSRGANGVIVVKTKTGKGTGPSFSYNYSLGVSNPTSLPDLITNSAEYMELSNEAYTNSKRAPLYTEEQIDLYRNATDRVKYPNHNWLDDVFKTAFTQNHYMSMSDNKENTSYRLGLGFTDQPGTMIGFEYKKYTFDLGLSSKLSKRVTAGLNMQVRYGNNIKPSNGSWDLFISTLAQTPLYPAKSPDGKWIASAYPNEKHNKNPVTFVEEDIRTRNDAYYMQGNFSFDVDLFEGLKWENKVGTNFDYSKYNDFRPVIQTYYWNDMSSGPMYDAGAAGLTVGRTDNVYTVFYSQLNFKRKIEDHNLSVIGGYQQEHNKYSWLNAHRNRFTSNLLRELNAGPADGMTNDGSFNEWAIRSFYGILNYDLKDKYLLGSSIRYDGTSRLPSETRWGLFYSVSGAWRISKENFLKNVKAINDLKLRGSWGQLGNQNIGNYPYQPTLSSADYAFGGTANTGYTARTLVDQNLAWETTRVLDFGIDITAFQNRLSFTADWFNKYTFDILRNSQVPLWLGLNPPTVNNGAVRNKGYEFSLEYKGKITEDLSFIVGANFQTFKNILTDYGKTEIGGRTIREEGYPLDEYYLYIWDGIFQSKEEIASSPKQPVKATPGDLKIKDINGDSLISDKDRTYVSGKYPAYQYSANFGLKWKNFDLDAQLFASQGQKIFVNGWGIEAFAQGSVPTTEWRNRWTPTNPTNTMPKIYLADGYAPVQSYPSTYFLKDASFIRLKNVQIGYTLPAKIMNMAKIKSLRFYVSAENVLTYSKYPGLDPERVGDGSYVNYPQNRTFTFGATLQF